MELLILGATHISKSHISFIDNVWRPLMSPSARHCSHDPVCVLLHVPGPQGHEVRSHPTCQQRPPRSLSPYLCSCGILYQGLAGHVMDHATAVESGGAGAMVPRNYTSLHHALWGWVCDSMHAQHSSQTEGIVPFRKSHDATFCDRNVHMCFKMVHCEMFVWCIAGFVRWFYCMPEYGSDEEI